MGAPASLRVTALLRAWAERQGARDPVAELGGTLARAFALPVEDARYGDNALAPGWLPFERSFCQLAPDQLRFDLEPGGPGVPAAQRWAESERLVREVVERRLPSVAGELLARLATWRATPLPASARFGAFLGAAYDAEGLREIKLYRELDGAVALPAGARSLVDALVALPGLEPLMSSLAATRDGVSERLYLRCREGLRLSDLSRLELGIAHRVPAVARLVALLSDGQLFLPPDTAILGVRALPRGWELKLELLPGALPLDPARVHALVERALADDLRAYRRWLGNDPGPISVVSVRAVPERAPALNVYVRPLSPKGRVARADR